MVNLAHEEIRLIARYRDEPDFAFFLMLFKKEGIVWPPTDRKSTMLIASQDLQIVFANEAYRRIYCYPEGESPLGKPLVELLDTFENMERVMEAFYDAGGDHEGILLTRRQDGEILWVQGEYHTILRDGCIVGHYGVEQDITRPMMMRLNYRNN